jgi:hypothetical protein
MRHTPMEPERLAALRTSTAELRCPSCGAQALTIVERYDPTRPEPPVAGLAYGPKGRPLWAWCGACNSHGRVTAISRKVE